MKILNGVYMLKAVSNSGPLIHLIQIGKFDLFNVFSNVFIPEKVYEEVSIIPEHKRKIKQAGNIGVITVYPVETERVKDKIKNFKIDEGELNALTLCKKMCIGVFLTDDLDARGAGDFMGLDVHGSVGIITLNYKKGLITLKDAEKSLNDLYDISNLFVTRSIIEIGINELRRFAKNP